MQWQQQARRSLRQFETLELETLEQRCLLTSAIVINEIHYDPPDKTEFSEFIELYNRTDASIDLSGWEFKDGVRYEFPSGTNLGPNEYLVVAQDPATVLNVFGASSIGPWDGSLRNSGERIRLVNAADETVDEVDYKRGFPWPTVGEEPGHSIELIHPDLENDLGGNWRQAGSSADTSPQTLIDRAETWRYFPGTDSPSNPATAWRSAEFNDSQWEQGRAPIGYGDSHVTTTLDMRGNYSTVYLRNSFEVDTVPGGTLMLKAQFDDGFHLWINGTRVLSENVNVNSTTPEATANSALENLEFVEFDLGSASGLLVPGENVVAVQMLNASLAGSSDAWFDAELSLSAEGNNSPGQPNVSFATNAPPATRRVDHGAGSVRSDQPVTVTTKVTDPNGVAAVTLEYQVVQPGDYFGRYLKAGSNGQPTLNPRYDDPANWTQLVMHDDGQSGDAEAGDDTFSAVIPPAVQQHRHLIRYRIRVEDTLGAAVQVPYADDTQHNFAYFVYDDIPDWTAADRPGRTPEQTFSLGQFNAIATYHLLTTADDHHDSQHIPDASTGSYGGSEYLWPGTLVYDGEVYDNIRYRARGGVWRYAMGKNMWKFDFNRGHGFQAKNDYGVEYSEAWDKLNFSALIQQGNYLHRGEQGLFESVGFKLFNLAGVESPHTHYVHFRVVDSTDEVTDSQFDGDFQGLYLAIEQPDGRMLEEHDLPDGNLYKIERHTGDSSNQGPTQVSDGSDVRNFINEYRSGNPSADWWRENLDLDRYFSYRTIVDGIHHYDIAYGKNYYYYHNPETGKFQVHPWDLDLTWANNMYGSGEHDFVQKVARNRELRVDYQNRVRELRDLLFNVEQTGMLIDEFAAMVYSPNELSWVDADRAMWDYNPIMTSRFVNSSKAGAGRFYEQSETDDFAGMMTLMKDYVVERSAFLDGRIRSTSNDAPQTPELTYIGNADYALNGLAFQTSAYADPNDSPFAAMEWRIAEITDPSNPSFGDEPPKYEITATYETGELDTYGEQWSTPHNELLAGALYRVRVRMKNSDGIWSHWSAPVQFSASAATAGDVVTSLRISEVHYHPADPSDAESAAGFTDADEFEFVELVNVGEQSIQLDNTEFRQVEIDGDEQGIDFLFPPGVVLDPGDTILIVENLEAFQLRYGDGFRIAGQWSGKLSNAGETLTLLDDGATVHSFAFDDAWYESTDGDGYSLEIADLKGDIERWSQQTGWRPSDAIGGSPGSVEFHNDDLAGDFDNNDRVDFADFLILSANFGKDNMTREQGDADDNGIVNFLDFLLLSANFGREQR